MTAKQTISDSRLTIEACTSNRTPHERDYEQLSYGVNEYKQVREEIHNEYGLMANRVNWLLASQTFLFTALAIATPKDQFPSAEFATSNMFYKVAPTVGICSCWMITTSITANILRIWDWKRIQRDILRKINYLSRTMPQDSLPGFGLIPPVGLPYLFFCLWGYILFIKVSLFFESRVLLAILFALIGILSVWSSAFFFHCLDEDISNSIFKRPINFIKQHRQSLFFATISTFLACIFCAIFA